MSKLASPESSEPPKSTPSPRDQLKSASKVATQQVVTKPQHPAHDDEMGWKTYWAAQNMPWRRAPEIDEERKKFLAEHRATKPEIQQGIYPFKNIKLCRADIEWLLATHESGGIVGPVDWDDAAQRKREGLDLRGADLRSTVLDHLPLARMKGGISGSDWDNTTIEQRLLAVVHLEGASLMYTRLEGASFTYGHLEGAIIGSAHLEGADLYAMHLEAKMPADLRWAFFDEGTKLDRISLANEEHIGPQINGVRWHGANLANMKWSEVQLLADESIAHLGAAHGSKKRIWQPDGLDQYLDDYLIAVHAYRQLAIEMKSWGLNEDADRFAYRALSLQRRVLRRQRHLLRWLGSLLLDLIAGYGYRPLRSFAVYVAEVIIFACVYASLGGTNKQPLSWNEALVVSLTAFHGRGFFATAFQPGDPQAAIAAVEAVVGLLTEIIFIATFTQRFFNR